MSGVINFCIRSYADVTTEQATRSGSDYLHQGTMYQTKMNPGSILTNGYNSDLVSFISHWRYWRWSGTKILTTPLARAPVDPAQVVAGASATGTIDPFDLSLFHAYKLDNWAAQTVPMEPTGGTDDDAYFLMDRSWKKCSVFRPWSLFIRPRGYSISYSTPQFGPIAPDGFNPDSLHVHGDPDNPVASSHGHATSTGHAFQLGVAGAGEVIDPYKSVETTESYPVSPHTHVILSEDEGEHGGYGYKQAIVQNHAHPVTVVTGTTGYDELAWYHEHDVAADAMANRLDFTYDSLPRSPGSIGAYAVPSGYAFTGRSRSAGGWWPVRGWAQASLNPIQILNRIEYPGFLWRCPKHSHTAWTFRQWEFHYFALKSPVMHQIFNPYLNDETGERGFEVSIRDMHYDHMLWNKKPAGTDLLTFDDAARMWRPVVFDYGDEADLGSEPSASPDSIRPSV